MWLWTVALHRCYRRLTLSFTTVKSWMGSSLLISKTMLDRAPLQCFSETKNYRVARPESWVSNSIPIQDWGYMWDRHTQQTQFPYRTEVICGVVTPKDNIWNDKNLLQKKLLKFLVDAGEHSFSIKKDVWCSIVERHLFNIKNQFVIARVPRRWV